jgi:Rad3-related DNA helicase
VTSYIDIDNRGDWIVWTEQGTLNAKPVTVSEPARELFARGKRVLIQSATIFDFATFQRILGLSNAALTFSANSDIPACNRVVIYRPVGDMAMTKMDGMLPLMCAEIARIVAEFGQYKGVIHTHSYQINQIVSQHLLTQLASRVITHNRDPYDRERAIQRHCSSKVPSILVSPCLTEGLDLKDDLARFQVVCKVPYPRLDIYTRARAMRDPQWYAFQTAWALVQMIGRAVRSDADYATTFVLDSQFEKFVRKNERILPGWWKEAVQFPARAA